MAATDIWVGLYRVVSIVMEIGKSQFRNFIIRLWDRNPIADLLLGNNAGNCLSIGKDDSAPAVRLPGVPGQKRPAGVLDYLVDKGVQVVEILETKDISGEEAWYVGQCYLFVFLDDEKPVLMVDSIEFHQYYLGDAQNLKIRNALFDFLRGYARAVGIEKVVLGKDGPILKSGENKGRKYLIGNDVDVHDLAIVAFDKIEKLGGYWNHRPYFLESISGSTAYLIS